MNETKRPLAVVTGASGGIGRAVCLALAAEGFDILGQCHSRAAKAESLRSEVEARDGRFIVVEADLAEPAGVDRIVEAVDGWLESEQSTIRGLVNGAALLLGPGLDAATESEFDKYIAVNLRAPFFLTQKLSQRMTAGGSIVNISSAGAHFSSSGDIVYAVSKAALESVSFHAAEALATKGVRINTIVPGFTDNGHSLFANPGVRQYMAAYSVFGDVADPAVVAEAVAFLLTARSAWTTGSILDVSGGSLLAKRRASSTAPTLRKLAESATGP